MIQKKANPKIEWGFFAVVPRVVRTQYKDLTHADKWLYTCLKDLCGDKGTCFRTLRSLKEETDISIASLSTMIPKLHDAGLIHAEKKRRSNSGKEVWHITIVDIWQSNKDFCSKIEQSHDEIVQNLNNIVQPLNKEAEVCSDIERDCSNFGYRRITLEEQHIEERTIEEESVASPNVDAAPAPVTDLHKWRTDSEKRRAMFADIPLSQDIEEDISMLETRKQEATDPQKIIAHTPGAGSPPAATPPGGSTAASVQASRPRVDAAQRTASSPGTPSGAVQASSKRKGKKVTQAKPAIVLTVQEQAFWDLWCSVWFNVDVPPTLNETAYGHVKTLAPHITTQEQMNSLEKYARKRLMEQSNISRREVQLGNCVSSYQSWKQTQQKTQRDDGPALGGYYYIGSVG